MAYGSILGQSFETSPVLDNYFTKDETLTSNTAALFGLGTDAVPDDVLAKARSLITTAQNTANMVKGRLKVVTGSYTGTGTNNRTFGSLDGTPQVLLIMRQMSVGGYTVAATVMFKGMVQAAMLNGGVSTSTAHTQAAVSFVDSVAFNYGTIVINGSNLINASGYTYYYIILCTDYQ